MMRLRSSGLALLGAGLLATTQAQFIVTELGGDSIQNKLYPTEDGKVLAFRYSYTRKNTPGNERTKNVKITIHRGPPTNEQLAEAGLLYPEHKGLGPNQPQATQPVDEVYRMKLEEQNWDPDALNVSGTVTIIDAAKLANFLSKEEQRPPPIFFELVLVSDTPSTNSPQLGRSRGIRARQDHNPVKFGLANTTLSRSSAFEDQQKLFANENGVIAQEPAGSTTNATPVPTQSSLPNNAASSSAGSGMSPGTTAGIAVGAALGALLLGTALVWFFVRRRRQNKAGKAGLGYDGGPGRSGDLVAEKEANAIVAESPRSPYSEDRTHRDSTLVGGASDTAGDYQPYSDNPTATANAPPPNIAMPVARAASANSRSTVDRSSAAFPASAPPPAIGEEGLPPRSDTGMSGRYAHLIEDNMTAEEIARLEEEERQLDAAIEQARGVTTK